MATNRTGGLTLGRRNPMTLPGAHRDSETPAQNEARTQFWRSMRRWTHPVAGCGAKY